VLYDTVPLISSFAFHLSRSRSAAAALGIALLSVGTLSDALSRLSLAGTWTVTVAALLASRPGSY